MQRVRKRKSLAQIVGGGYLSFWETKKRYRVLKGGRASKKSTTTALNHIQRLCEYPESNLLVVRQVFKDHRDSTYAQLKWAIHQLGVQEDWIFKVAPLEMVRKSTRQKILFRGLDDPLGITSITVDTGYLNFVWIEEAFQVKREDDFDKLDMSIRGRLPEGYFKQITLTFNPWSERHWLKRRFFDTPDPDTFTLTTTYEKNEFLGEEDKKLFEKMKVRQPKRYKVEGLGHWGIAEGVIFDNWEEREFDHHEIAKMPGIKSAFAMDFGYTNDPTAFIAALVDMENMELWVFDEHYQRGMLTKQIADMLKNKGYAKERIIADNEGRVIDELRLLHKIPRIEKAQKGSGSILGGIEFLKEFQIYVHPRCQNLMIELENYTWSKDKYDNQLNKPIDEWNHAIDALRYATERFRTPTKVKSTNIRKQLGI